MITLSQWVDYAFAKDSSEYSPLSVDNLDEALPLWNSGLCHLERQSRGKTP